MSEFLAVLVDYAWGLPLLVLLMGGGIGLVVHSRFLPLTGFLHAFKIVSGKFHHGQKPAIGQISHFQALSNALAATIGMGNIAGVAVAISQGGPGAIFWMWVAGLIGMNTKFYECTLALLYRGKDYKGEIQGGPMYVIEEALKNKLGGLSKILAYFFAICGLIGTLCLFQVNQLSAYVVDQFFSAHAENFQFNVKMAVGIFSASLVLWTLLGGLKRLSNFTAKMVPAMCLLYVISCIYILFFNIENVPVMLKLIFTEAVGWDSVAGGISGEVIRRVLNIGIKRAAFSNEAGVGTAPMAHSNTKTSEPVSEGYVAMLGPFLDTIVVCTLTALVILVSLSPAEMKDADGIVMTTRAFENALPGIGSYFLGAAVLLFSLSTMMGYSNYNQKCWDFVFRGKFIFNDTFFKIWFCATILFGAISAGDDVVNILDIGFAFMAIPNMLATIILAPKIKAALLEYNQKFLK
ncbi:MAG: amino acid carrier protein [Bdellovibrionota bacterium]|nr:amino acid carrier protein [Bdellovibrionota bacterium]